MIIAYPTYNNLWRLQSNSNAQEIFDNKDKIKKLGGKWNGKFWSVPEGALADLNAEKMIFVTYEGYCHTKSGNQWVETKIFNRGFIENPYCSGCQKRHKGLVLIKK